MNKSFNVSLNGIVFNIEEDAYEKLSGYLESIKNHYNAEDGKEILADIESNLAEKFSACLNSGKQVIILEDVAVAIKIMGTVDECAGEKKPAEDKAEELSEDKEGKLSRRLYRNPGDMVIAGVCSGLAAYFGVDPVYIRLLFVVLIFLNGFGLLAYLIFWLVMPVAETNVQKLEMRGRPVNLKKLEQVVKEKAAQVTQEGKNAYKNNQRWITRILSFPIDVIRQVMLFLKKILSKILPIIGILIGIGFSLAVAAGVLGLSMAVGIMMFNINSPYITSGLPVQEIAGSIYYYIGLAGLYFFIFIPMIFLLSIGLCLIRRKNIFCLRTVICLFALWIASAVGFGVSALNIAPMVKDKFDRNAVQNTVSENIKFDNGHVTSSPDTYEERGDLYASSSER